MREAATERLVYYERLPATPASSKIFLRELRRGKRSPSQEPAEIGQPGRKPYLSNQGRTRRATPAAAGRREERTTKRRHDHRREREYRRMTTVPN